ncbi:MAG: peptide chain release factor N(5)-glutamine methyltransferase [Nitrospira sp.]|jgi:release factor glutamine methyltransferase|nr:peptide chain release factor N(5)-glutamine methyltransferase [Nitrospira sp.]MDH4236390.1 peptide chain release factor N(5)-glutamine methyltransferase [Nitrospira sp.]MDH5253320.1 peptide chain release factor N(5)-glutamine methyltransferase [Nitrospira sp.]MDH5624740.1 peptide chain release factor N(5)-glutamine methyltransferase [Nitrospira sp.]
MVELKTIDDLVAWAKHTLEQAGVENAAQESRWLVADALGLEGHHLASKAEQPVSAEQWEHAGSLVSRRAAREPLQYILGTQEFCGLEFQVSSAVLIPRPETEVLVQETLRAVDLDNESVLVDMGTGSGCVAITLATILGKARIVAVDRSPEALAVAKDNAERHAVAEKIQWVEGDLLSALRGLGMAGAVDVIASNPPYIAEADWAGLQPEVREFEPRSALFSGPKGTEFHERLLRESKEFLAPGGSLVMEIGQGQYMAVRQMAEHIGGYAPLRVVEDEAGIERVVIATRME